MGSISLQRKALLGFAFVTITFSTVAAECTRETLLNYADIYLAAQVGGITLDTFQGFFAKDNFTYWENNRGVDIRNGVMKTKLKVDYRRTIVDVPACASYTELIATGPTPYTIATQLHHNPDDMTMNKIDAIVATSSGSLFFNASLTLQYAEAQDWSPLDLGKRQSRDTLRDAMDTYLDMWSNSSAYQAVPWGIPCERIEGSRHVTPCTEGAPKGGSKPNSMRRYIIDGDLGAVNVLCSFTSVGDIPDSHEFRIEVGKIRYVNTITLCAIGPGGNWPSCTQREGTSTAFGDVAKQR